MFKVDFYRRLKNAKIEKSISGKCKTAYQRQIKSYNNRQDHRCYIEHIATSKSQHFCWIPTKRCLIYSKIFNFQNFCKIYVTNPVSLRLLEKNV